MVYPAYIISLAFNRNCLLKTTNNYIGTPLSAIEGYGPNSGRCVVLGLELATFCSLVEYLHQ